VTLGAILGTALLVALTRPTAWLLALASFLVRGGILWFLAPILILPTPVGLANALGPTIVEFVFAGLSLGLILAMLGGAVGIVIWIVGGGLAAAAIEVELMAMVAGDDELAPTDRPGDVLTVPSGRTLRVLAVHLIALIPAAVALVAGTTRIVAVTYAELTLPSGADAPFVWRVLEAVPDAIVLVLLAWVLGEVVGALASRRVVLGDPSILRGLVGAVVDVVRHPVRNGALFGLPSLVLVLVLLPTAAASAVSWTGLRAALADGSSPVAVGGALALFLGLWAVGLTLTGAVCAWRQAVWTVAMVPADRGTFGGSADGRPGDWNAGEASGTL